MNGRLTLAAAVALLAAGAPAAQAQSEEPAEWRPRLEAAELKGTAFAAAFDEWVGDWWTTETGGLTMEFAEVGEQAARAWPQVVAGDFSGAEDAVLLKFLALTDSTLGVLPAEACAAMAAPAEGGFTRMLAALDAPLARRWVAMLDEALVATVAPWYVTPMAEGRTFVRDFARGLTALPADDRDFLLLGVSESATAAERCRAARLTTRALGLVPEKDRVAAIRTALAPVKHDEVGAFRVIDGTDPATGTPMVRATVYSPYFGVSGLRWECRDGGVTVSLHTGAPFERRPSPRHESIAVDARFGEREITAAWALDREARSAQAPAGAARRITAAARAAERVTIVASDGRVSDPLDADEARKIEFSLDGAGEALGRVLACGEIPAN